MLTLEVLTSLIFDSHSIVREDSKLLLNYLLREYISKLNSKDARKLVQ